MKTVVLGLFDQLEDAQRVLAQLSTAPLDLDTVQILHRDPEVQRQLSEQAGIEPRRAMRTGLVSGAILGAGLGFAAGWSGAGEALLPGPGPLLTLAGGALLGALLGALGGAVSESSQIPDAHARAALAAVGEGSTMVSIQTSNLPTARAIGELFRAGGSRVLDGALEGSPADASRHESLRSPTFEPSPSGPEAAPASAEDLPEGHAAFAPPWRRETGEGASVEAPPVAGTLFPDAAAASAPEPGDPSPDRPAIRHGETVVAVDRTSRDVQPRDLPETSAPPDRGSASSSAAPPAAHPTPARTDAPGSAAAADRGLEPPLPDAAPDAAPEAARSQTAAPRPAARSSAPDPVGLERLEVSARVHGALRKAGLRDLAALRRAVDAPGGLESLPGIGPAARHEIEAALTAMARSSGAPERTGRREQVDAAPLDPRLQPVQRAADALLREIFEDIRPS